jgi:UDP-2-acetamido-3-amino-2,3-dideoxy-glucuronate N-acetyltransferase
MNSGNSWHSREKGIIRTVNKAKTHRNPSQKSSTITKIAVVGAGYWGQNVVRSFHQLGALGAVCDHLASRESSIRSAYPDCAYYQEFDALLKDPAYSAVAIATPAETHFSMVEKALWAGKDVLVEKPLSLDVKSGRALIDLAKKKNRILMVGHLLWYHPAILKLKSLIDSGELGRIQYIYSNRLNLGKIRREENILWSFAPHDISVILGLLNEMPSDVTTQAGNYLHKKIADVTVSCLSFPSGVRAHIFVSWLHPFKEQKLVIVGDRKMAVFNDVSPDRKLLLYPHSIEWKGNIPVAEKAEPQYIAIPPEEPLIAECQHFLDCVSQRTRPRTDGEEALRVLNVLERCQQGMDRSTASSLPPPQGIHESAVIDPDVLIGEGTSIWHFSHILTGSKIGEKCRIGQNVVIGPRASIGKNVKIQNNVSVYEGVTLEDDVFCGPSMVFTNVFNPRSEIPRMKELQTTLVKKGATLGANSTILCGITIGQYAFIGAGAVVTKDVPDYALVVGNPARATGWMCRCGVKLVKTQKRIRCSKCKRSYQLQGKPASLKATT